MMWSLSYIIVFALLTGHAHLAEATVQTEVEAETETAIVVRPSIQISAIATSSAVSGPSVSIADMIDFRSIKKNDRHKIKRLLSNVVVVDRLENGGEQIFVREALENVINAAERRLEAAGLYASWKIPARVRVFRNRDLTLAELKKVVLQKLQEKCEGCEVRLRSLDVPGLVQKKISSREVRSWNLEPRDERPRGSFSWPLQIYFGDRDGPDLGDKVETVVLSGVVEYSQDVWVATHLIESGRNILPDMIRQERRDITYAIDEPASQQELSLSVAKRTLSVGEPLWRSVLRKEQVVRPGESVRVQAGDSVITVSSLGVALTAGAVGDTVQVRVGSLKKQVSGIVKERGLVEIH